MFNSITIITVLISLIVVLISNYTAFGYGVRIGKALQKEIPEAPLIEPIRRTGKRLLSLAKDKNKKSYIQKKADKEDKEETGIFD